MAPLAHVLLASFVTSLLRLSGGNWYGGGGGSSGGSSALDEMATMMAMTMMMSGAGGKGFGKSEEVHGDPKFLGRKNHKEPWWDPMVDFRLT